MTNSKDIPLSYKNPTVSVVIPSFNEADNIPKLCFELEKILSKIDIPWEIIFSDDGSTDDTWQQITKFHNQFFNIKGVRLSRNFGHQHALLAGLNFSSGDAVISMDADLQHPPELIHELISAWKSGYKVVQTIRTDPDDYGLFKKFSSKIFYKVFSYISGVSLYSGMADFRLLDRQVLNELLGFGEQNLFIRGIVQWLGYPYTNIHYKAEKRYRGKSKYNLMKMLRFAWHGMSSFSLVPLRIAMFLGFTSSGISFLTMLYAIRGKLITGQAVPGWASSLTIISFFFAILFVFLGVLSEYIGRILLEVRNRPRFVVDKYIGHNE